MKKFENTRRKTPFGSPYSVYKEKINPINITKHSKNNSNINNHSIYNMYTINTSNIPIKQKNSKNYDLNFSSDFAYLENLQKNNNNINNNNINDNNNNSIQKMINRFNGVRKNEITNPGYYFQRMNEDYYKYRLEQKRVLDYNHEQMENKFQNKFKKEPDINPYNPIDNKPFELGKTDLLHNPILNPVNDYSYNKYLEKSTFKNNNYNNHLAQSMKNLNINNPINNINNNNYNLYYNRNFSPLQNAGNQLLNNN